MKTKLLIGTALLCGFSGITAYAQGTPSSKATAAINTSVGCTVQSASTLGDPPIQSCHDIFSGASIDVTPDNFARLMQTTVKLSNSQSLFVTPSFVTGLFTSTKVKSSPGGGPSTATAQGGVYLRAVLYDSAGNAILAEPIKSCNDNILGCYADAHGDKGVVLDTRIQSLTQDISNCIVSIPGVTGTGTCSFDLTTTLMLDTTSAHSFGFIFPNVGVGVYRLEIQAAVNANATVSGSGTAVGAAAYGVGSVTVESVRLVHDFSF